MWCLLFIGSSFFLLGVGFYFGFSMREYHKTQELQTEIDAEKLSAFQDLPVQQSTSKQEPAPDFIKVALEAERLRVKYALHDDTIQRPSNLNLNFFSSPHMNQQFVCMVT
jgi:hypothetical protein